MFLNDSPPNQANAALYARDIADDGYVSNFTRLWGWRSDLFEAFFNLPKRLMDETTLTVRERAILACAIAANLGDSYCALGWGARLASESSPTIAAAVLQGMKHSQLSARENALATWAHKVVGDPNAITAGDVDRLGATGVTEQEIFDATLFVAFRLAFSTVTDALGARPDRELVATVPDAVRDAVAYGRSVSEQPSRR